MESEASLEERPFPDFPARPSETLETTFYTHKHIRKFPMKTLIGSPRMRGGGVSTRRLVGDVQGRGGGSPRL